MRSAPLALAAVLAAILAITEWRVGGPDPLPRSAPASSFSAARALDALQNTIGGKVPHPVGAAEHAAVRDRVVKAFQSLGYETRVHTAFSCDARINCAPVENIEALMPGAPLNPAVTLVAHYDSVPASPGASDDGVGVATMLEIARAVRAERHRNPILFVVDDGEEAGLLGAEAIVATRDLMRPIGTIVNLEARGTSGPSYLFETSRNNGRLAPFVARAMPRPATASAFPSIYDRLPNDTDLTVFKRNGYEGVNFAFLNDVNFYHTTLDDVRHVSLRTLQHQGDNVLAITRALADASIPLRAGSNAVWFDVLGFFVISWPAPATLPASIVVLAAALALAVLAIRRGAAPLRGILVAALWIVCALALSIGATLLIQRAIFLHASGSFAAYPLPENAAAWAAAAACVLGIPGFLKRRLQPEAEYVAFAVIVSALAVALAAIVTGASYLLLVPAAVTTAMAFLLVFRRTNAFVVALVSSAIAAALFIPLIAQLYAALGVPVIPAIALFVALLAMLVAPAVPRTRAVFLTALALAVGFTALAALLPRVTSSRPARNSIAWLDDGTGQWWLVGRPTSEMRQSVAFKTERRSFFPWRPGSLAYAPSRASGIATVVMRRQSNHSPEIVRISVASQRHAPRVALYFATPARVKSIRVNGVMPPPRPARFRTDVSGDWHRVIVRASTMEVEIRTEEAAPIDAFALDFSYGVPTCGNPLIDARNASKQVPSDDGDTTITMRSARY